MSSSATGFDPGRSRISADTLATFLSSPIEDNLESVPGIGPATIKKLNDDGINTTFQLIGLFLSLRGENMTQEEHCNALWYYLQELGINGPRSGIVQAIAERTNIMIPGIYYTSDDQS